MANSKDALAEETTDSDFPFRYDAALANEIELKWQDKWDVDHTYYTPNPVGPMAEGFDSSKTKQFILDMFPYPSGAGLHVGHPLGFIGTDVYARYKRMTGFNVLHAMGYDAFGLPAEQYAIQTNTHPRITTENNIANMKRQLRRVGLGHDERRGISTIDPEYYKWTQWIFLTIYNSYFDEVTQKARPIQELIDQFKNGERTLEEKAWDDLTNKEKADVIDEYRLAYLADSIVNWCPGLGTVLANEEVTADGKSERGNFDVFKKPMKQWMMRITKYADRLVDDLKTLDWPEAIKIQQRNWIGKSRGASVLFDVSGHTGKPIEVFTTRIDTLFSAAFMVLAPEHPLVQELTTDEYKDQVQDYVASASKKNDIDRTSDDKEKTGVFTGAYAINPANDEPIPVWVGDFVLASYGTGAVFGDIHDERDFEFAMKYEIPARVTIVPQDADEAELILAKEKPYTGDGILIESAQFTGMDSATARIEITKWLETQGKAKEQINYKLRDWLFSRQRYWGEPFPIVFDEEGIAYDLPESMLPVQLPELENFAPETTDDVDADVKPPLARVQDWVNVELDLGDGKKMYRREVNTMPNWAGSCWYYLRYLDPFNSEAMVDADVEKYWTGDEGKGVVDLYVGGAEHAVLHLLYARFWHKVLYDRGYVSSAEPFQALLNQGMIQAHAYTDDRGFYVEASKVQERDGKYYYEDTQVNREYGKMGKSLKNVVTPDEMCELYGADTLRLYEMFMGPLEMSRPWSTADVSGVYRFLQRVWRNIVDEKTGEINVAGESEGELKKTLHKTIAGVSKDYSTLSYNTAIAKMFELNNELTKYVNAGNACPKDVASAFTLMLAPLAPHVAEELWEKLGHSDSVVYQDFPVADESLLVEDEIEIPVQINGKVRSKITIPVGSDQARLEELAKADEKIASQIEGKKIVKVIAVPDRMVNIVVAG